MVFRFVSLSLSKFVLGLSVFLFLFVFELCGFRLDFLCGSVSTGKHGLV